MKISVIIPTYNEESVIEECLESLNFQTFKDFEIIVVDDGSTDKTWEILSKFKIQKFKQNHLGPAAARNLGASRARGEILVFVDADMTFDKNFLKNLIKPIIENKAKGTFSNEEYVENWENIWAKCLNINENWEPMRRHKKPYPKSQKVFRAILKSEFDKVKGFDKGGYTDDYSLAYKLGYEAVLAPDAKFYHKNPDTLKEVFFQAKWVAKRKYKLGFLGFFAALFRISLPATKLVGIYKAIKYHTPAFFIFKLVYNTGATFGLFEYYFLKKSSK